MKHDLGGRVDHEIRFTRCISCLTTLEKHVAPSKVAQLRSIFIPNLFRDWHRLKISIHFLLLLIHKR